MRNKIAKTLAGLALGAAATLAAHHAGYAAGSADGYMSGNLVGIEQGRAVPQLCADAEDSQLVRCDSGAPAAYDDGVWR